MRIVSVPVFKRSPGVVYVPAARAPVARGERAGSLVTGGGGGGVLGGGVCRRLGAGLGRSWAGWPADATARAAGTGLAASGEMARSCRAVAARWLAAMASR